MENMKIGGLLSLDEAFIESRATWLSRNEPDKVATHLFNHASSQTEPVPVSESQQFCSI